MKNRKLVLMVNFNYFFKYITKDNIRKMYLINDSNWFRFIRRCFNKLKIQLPSFFLGKWKKDIQKYDAFIIFDNQYDMSISKYIKKKNKNSKIIFYYWNYINNYNKKFLNDPNIDEFYSFDKEDSTNYNLSYNPQLYTNKIKAIKNDKKYDILFLGRSKLRNEYILNLKRDFLGENIIANIIIIEDEKQLISYDEYLKLISESKCLLEVIDENHSGLTLRCMESLFLSKKLVTNNQKIDEYDFYNPDNIFILGKDDFKNIKKFLNKPYQKIDSKIINNYDFNSWYDRF